MQRQRRLVMKSACAAAVLMALGLANVPARAAEYTMKIALVTLDDTQHWYANKLKEVLEKATNGRVEVKVFPRGQLGSPAATIQGLQLGTIEAAMYPIDFFAGVDPRAGVFSIPYMFKDRAHANKVLQDKDLYNYTLNMMDNKGIVGVMMVGQADGRYIAKNPIRKVSDFSGKKMRVNATDAERERMKRLGATAIPMGLGEMLTSLKSGVIDGTMSGISIHVNFNLQDISKTLLKTEDTLLITYAGISKKWLDSLPPDLRATIVKEARALQPWTIDASNREDVTLTKKWLDRGGEIIEFSPEDTALFHKKIDSVGATVTAKNPAVKAFFDKVKAAGQKH
jgi:TRAP-type C4-dicarboxylate transport system substrate-binding protein